MHATYYRPGGVYRDLPDSMPKYQPSRFRSQKDADRLNERRSGSLLDFIEDFTQRFPACVDEYETLLTDNRIWKQRTVNIGVVTPERALQPGLHRADAARLGRRLGPAQEAAVRGLWPDGLRHPGRRQRRLLRPLPGARRGDAPVEPHRPQCVDWLRAIRVRSCSTTTRSSAPSREEMKGDMESLIHHFKFFTEGYCVPEGEAYARGRGARRASSASTSSRTARTSRTASSAGRRASRTSRRSTRWCTGHMLADVVAVIGTAGHRLRRDRSVSEPITMPTRAKHSRGTCARRSTTGWPSSRRTASARR